MSPNIWPKVRMDLARTPGPAFLSLLLENSMMHGKGLFVFCFFFPCDSVSGGGAGGRGAGGRAAPTLILSEAGSRSRMAGTPGRRVAGTDRACHTGVADWLEPKD